MMSEMVRIKEVSNPDEVLLVVDSMIGQEAADLTKSFHEKVGISGAILTQVGWRLKRRRCFINKKNKW